MINNDLAISVRGLSKSYQIAHEAERHTTAAEALASRLRHPFRRAERETFWALRDISFEIRKGDVVGIIGHNGAGKSTLLKVLSRITEPTAGEIDLYGRVGSLLEVGTGFHPELTGRENIYLNGAILGMRRREIAQQFDAIVEFAGAGKFLDTPVKRYSSGMYVRLAFAVAAHLEPEILIVDEVLAVGDAEFQRRCLGKMEDVARQGRTVLFVSHNMAAVNRMCRQGLLLKGGRVHRAGPVEAVVSEYLSSGGDAEGEREWSEPAEAPGNGGPMRLRAVRVLDAEGEPCANLDIRRSLTVEIHYEVLEALPRVRVAFRLVAGDGSVAFTSSDSNDAAWRDRTRGPGTYVSRCRIPGDFLNEGRYSLTVSADVPLVQVLFLEENALAFRVEQTGGVSGGLPERWPGAVCPLLPWEIQTTEPEVAQRPSEPNTHGPKLLARK